MKDNGRIIKGVGGQYWIAGGDELIGTAMVRGILRQDDKRPLPGDFVRFSSSGDPDVPLVIDEILPRRNFLVRPPVANLEGMVITMAAAEPAPDFYLADKLLVICRLKNIEPILVLTKTDLGEPDYDISSMYEPAGCPVLVTNPDESDNLNKLREWMKGKVVSFAGQSGVGKSTLLNRLFAARMMQTSGLSEKIGRGRHTTRHVELFYYQGGYIADTPGFSSLELNELGIEGEDLIRGYPELMEISGRCRFSSCRHLGEAGCAAGESTIHPERLERYRYFREQLDNIDKYKKGNRKRYN